ncbi:hypothetical protein F5Y03DRAFT_146408 [Xylaria venustula]|nr:hypothetical protein F5Y03DRAFT_146408 [Xylaria venustula]
MPCSRCFDRSLECKMMDGVTRCKECVRAGRTCDGSGISFASANNVVSEHHRLEREEKEAEKELVRVKEDLNTVLGRLSRLRQQRRFLKEKATKMVQRGLASLDKLDEIKRIKAEQKSLDEEQKREKKKAQAAQAALADFNWDSLNVSFEIDPSLPALVDQDVVGGTDLQPSRHSPSVS